MVLCAWVGVYSNFICLDKQFKIIYFLFSTQFLCASVSVCVYVYALHILNFDFFLPSQIMHLFVALLLTNDDSAAIPNTIDESSGQQSNSQQLAAESMPTKFNLHAFLKDKLLEPYIKQIYGKWKLFSLVLNMHGMDCARNQGALHTLISLSGRK